MSWPALPRILLIWSIQWTKYKSLERCRYGKVKWHKAQAVIFIDVSRIAKIRKPVNTANFGAIVINGAKIKRWRNTAKEITEPRNY